MRAAPTPRTRGPALAAFTLVELMISLTVGGIAITSIYAVGAASTRQFYQQQQIASAQSALRMAMNQVKRDIARAGYLGTPNANAPTGFAPQSCAPMTAPLYAPNTTGSIAAISHFDDDIVSSTGNSNDAVDPTGTNTANGFTVDSIKLLGNYETSDEYPGITAISDNTISIDQNWQSFQRDFTLWHSGNPGALDQPLFLEAFAVGRLIRIQTTRRLRHFATITAVTVSNVVGQDPQITFMPAIPASCLADVKGGWVAPLSMIRYIVENAPAAEVERFTSSTGPVAQLIRREVQPANKATAFAANPGNTRAVLDYVVGFNLAFTMNAITLAGAADNYAPGVIAGDLNDNIPTGTTANPAGAVNATPELVRAVSIELAVRTPEQDATLPWTQAGCANMLCFQVFPSTGSGARPGTARVRRLRADVFLPNVAYEGY